MENTATFLWILGGGFGIVFGLLVLIWNNLKNEIKEIRTEFKEIRTELKTDINDIRLEIKEIKSDIKQMDKQIAILQVNVNHIYLIPKVAIPETHQTNE